MKIILQSVGKVVLIVPVAAGHLNRFLGSMTKPIMDTALCTHFRAMAS
jgi:hypothetical protein